MNEMLDYAGRLLARREHSVGELRRKLERKWPGDEGIESALERLVEERMLSDQRFAAAFVRSRVTRLQGPRKIRAELKQRFLCDADIATALESEESSWTDLAMQWLARQGSGASDYEGRARYYRRLVNRGFTHDQAMDALTAHSSRDPGV
jgi:regulatory protein